jgi:hypothetical protein
MLALFPNLSSNTFKTLNLLIHAACILFILLAYIFLLSVRTLNILVFYFNIFSIVASFSIILIRLHLHSPFKIFCCSVHRVSFLNCNSLLGYFRGEVCNLRKRAKRISARILKAPDCRALIFHYITTLISSIVLSTEVKRLLTSRYCSVLVLIILVLEFSTPKPLHLIEMGDVGGPTAAIYRFLVKLERKR